MMMHKAEICTSAFKHKTKSLGFAGVGSVQVRFRLCMKTEVKSMANYLTIAYSQCIIRYLTFFNHTCSVLYVYTNHSTNHLQ